MATCGNVVAISATWCLAAGLAIVFAMQVYGHLKKPRMPKDRGGFTGGSDYDGQ